MDSTVMALLEKNLYVAAPTRNIAPRFVDGDLDCADEELRIDRMDAAKRYLVSFFPPCREREVQERGFLGIKRTRVVNEPAYYTRDDIAKILMKAKLCWEKEEALEHADALVKDAIESGPYRYKFVLETNTVTKEQRYRVDVDDISSLD